MAYQVLARKWRPRTFAEMVGQQHVLRALVNALDKNRLHHAYLFSGTRGVGKTTIARIFAKSLNCETGVGSTPCGECSSCREIDEGRFVDLIEVDAASRSRVEETRELLDNVQYTPTRGRYKVYLIDEVHMFSTSSFNALLKTLEEPPPHVKFLLATTDPQKLPATILSRCLQFALKRLPPAPIRSYLGRVLEAEGIEHELAALAQLARAADGSMRDALSLLDQAIAFGAGSVAEQDVRAMLGSIAMEHVYDLVEALAAGDAGAVLERVDAIADQSPDYAVWLGDLTTLLQRIALAQQVPEAIDDDPGERQRIFDLARRLAPEDLQLYYQIALIGRRDLPLSPQPRGGFEMVLLRMLAFRPAAVAGASAGRPPQPAEASPSASSTRAAQAPVTPVGAPGGREAAAGPTAEGPRAGSPGRTRSPLDAARNLLQRPGPAPSPRPGGGPTRAQGSLPPGRGGPGSGAQLGFAGGAAAAVSTGAVALAEPPPPEPPPDLDPYYASQPFPEPEPPMAQVVGLQAVPRRSVAGPPAAAPTPPPSHPPAPAPDTGAAPSSAPALDWLTLVPRLGLSGLVQELAAQCAQRPAEDGMIGLSLDPAKRGLLNEERRQRLEQALRDCLGRPVRLRIELEHSSTETLSQVRARARAERLEAARAAIDRDPRIRLLQERFGAHLHADSVRPLEGDPPA